MSNKNVITIIPSHILTKGIEQIILGLPNVDLVESCTHLPPLENKRFEGIEPDLVIIDPFVLDYHSRTVAKNFLAEYFDCPIVALSSIYQSEANIKQYDAYIDIYENVKNIENTIREALCLKKESVKTSSNELTVREKEILICVAKGMLNKQIADKFNISIYTVISHRKNIMKKTHLDTVPALTAYAIIQELIDINSVG